MSKKQKGLDLGGGAAILVVVCLAAFHREILSLFEGMSVSETKGINAEGMFAHFFSTLVDVLINLALAAGIVFAILLVWRLWHVYGPMKMRAIRVKLQDPMDLKPADAQRLAEGLASSLWERKRWKRVYFRRNWIKLRITRDKQGKFSIHYLAPVKKSTSVLRRIRLAYSQAIVEMDQEYWGIPFLRDHEGIGGHMKMTKPGEGYGLSTELKAMGDMLALMPRESVLEVTFSPVAASELADDGQDQVKDLMEKKRKIREDTKKMQDASNRYIGRSAFHASIFLWAAKHELSDVASEIQTQTRGDYNELVFHRYRWGMKWRNSLRWWFPTPLPSRRMLWNDRELAHFLQLPEPDHQEISEDLEVTIQKVLPKSDELRKGIRIGWVDDPAGKNRDARLRTKTLVNHGFIAGKSGGGKGAFLNFFMQDFLKQWVTGNGPGGTYADPHQTGILNILNLLIEMEKEGTEIPWDRVVVLAVGPSVYPAPLNIFHRSPEDDIDEVAGEAVEAIMSAFPGDLSRSRVQMENAIHGLLWDDETHTLRDLGRVFKFSEGKLRRRLRERLRNPIVKEWFINELEPKFNPDKPQDVNVDAVTTRVNPFLSKRSMQRIFAQPDNALDVEKILNEGYLVLLDFKDAPDEAFKLSAGWLTNRYYRKAKKRVGGGRPHVMIYDECQLFHVQKFTNIVKESRKFGLGLVLMTQEIDKLDKDLLSAMGTNAGFACSVAQSTGAKVMSDLMQDQFTPSQLKGLRRVINHKGEVERLEGALWSLDGTSNIIAPPPAFILNGEPTRENSREAKRAMKEAEEKMLELMKRTAKHKEDVDRLLAGEEPKKTEPKKLEMEEKTVPEETPSSSSPATKQREDYSLAEWEKAVDVVIAEQKASASLLQRQLKIGYTKAAKLIDALEQRKIIGPAQGRKPRAVLAKNREDVS